MRPPRHEKCRAVIAREVTGRTVVLATDSAWLRWDLAEISPFADDVELRCEDATQGRLYLWVGTIREVCAGEDYHSESRYEGMLRPIRPDEYESLLAMTPPEEEE